MRTGRKSLRPAQKVTDLITLFIDWIYPPQCRICGKEPDLTPFLCSSCYHELEVFDAAPDSVSYHQDHPADKVKAYLLFNEKLQTLIHDIKYRDASYIATFLGKKMGEFYQASDLQNCEAIVPVPLHAVRKRERTYNQSACIAKGLSKQWDVPLRTDLVKRQRNTGTQTKLNKDERQVNIHGAFCIRKKRSIPKSVCVVDDVFTTGATTMELARVLKNAGVETVHILCLATPPHGNRDENKKGRD